MGFIQWRHDYWPVIIMILICLLNEVVLASVFLVSILIIFLIIKHILYSKELTWIVLSAFLVRLVFIVIDELFQVYNYALDSTYYNIVAGQIINNYIHNVSVFYRIIEPSVVKYYSLFISIFYYILGNNQIYIRILNGFLGALAVAVVYSICQRIFPNKKVAYWASLLTAFYPSCILFTSLNLRDSLILYLSLEMINQFLKASDRNFKTGRSLLFLILVIIIGLLRPQNFFLFSLIIIIYFFIVFMLGDYSYKVKLLFLLILFSIVGILFVYQNELILEFIEYPLRALPRRAIGGSAYLADLMYHSLFDIIKYAPIRFLYFTFGPFFWDVKNLLMLIAFLESIFIMFIFYLSFKYLRHPSGYEKNNHLLFLFLFGLFGLIANALVDSNYGTVIRHRMVYIIPFIIFASANLINKDNRVCPST